MMREPGQMTMGGAACLSFLFVWCLTAMTAGGAEAAGPALSIDAGAGHRAISEDIYGMNFAGEDLAAALRLPVRRWGGNRATRYNWQTSMTNTGSDWYFENLSSGSVTVGDLPNGSATDQFVEQDRRTGTRTLLTVPLIGWTVKGTSPRTHPYDCSFKVSKYGTQQSVDQWDTDCGNGRYPDGSVITGNAPDDTGMQIGPEFVTAWMGHLTGRYGAAGGGGVVYYSLDNEPMLWHDTHRDIHPERTTYDEIRDRTYQYGATVKTADPGAKTFGPVVWGWCAYFYSAADGCGTGADYNAHGGMPFVPWYLQQMRQYEQQYGVRILDYLDLHYYPAANGVALSTAGGDATRALRLRSTRSLWDPSYIDESWISDTAPGGVAVQLIPRMRQWVDTYYPGTKLALTEYNFGGLESINGALAQADILGIFGREGLDFATLWQSPDVTEPGAFAFRIFRNYDGGGNGFGDVSVQAMSADQDALSVYAALRSSDNALTVIVINKSATDLTSPVNLAGMRPLPSAEVYRYSASNPEAIVRVADQQVSAGGFSAVFPAGSITLFVIRSEGAAQDCSAILSSELALHIPVVEYQSGSERLYIVGDLHYVPTNDGRAMFGITSATILSSAPSPDCGVSTLSADMSLLHIPYIIFNGGELYLWADFTYAPASDGTPLFQVINYGVID